MGNKFTLGKKSNGNSSIGKPLNCPNCNRLFPAKTTYNSLNAHLDSCLNNVQNVPNQQQIQQTNPFQLQNPFTQQQYQDLGSEYVWMKIKQGDNYNWERRKVENVNEAMLSQLPASKVKTLSFPEKQCWFKIQINKHRIPWQMGADHLKVEFQNVLDSTIKSINKCNMHKEVKIDFLGDKVQDAGGLLREWLVLLFKEVMNPSMGLFQMAETEDVCYRINPDLQINQFTESCLSVCGKAIGKAVFERYQNILQKRLTLPVFFDRPFIKQLIDQPVTLEDIQFFDRQLYKSWKYLLQNSINPDELLEYFVICKSRDCIELKPDGCETMVTNENKQEYVDLCIKHVTNVFIKPALDIILKEVYKIIPKEYWQVFEAEEIEMIMYGVPFIDVNEWKEQSTYKPPYSAKHKNILWFWKVVEEFDQQQLQKLLQYCTGSQRIPVNGFSKLESNRGTYAQFKIVQVQYTGNDCYPQAHTCFNRLDLPQYTSLEMTRKFLRAVVDNDLEGVFGLE